MAEKRGLLKLTKSEIKINNLLSLKKITMQDVDTLTEREKIKFGEMTHELLLKASPEKRDEIMLKMEDVLTSHTKNDFWEYNHSRIMFAVESLLTKGNRMPTRSEIAEAAQLSRQTVSKHLKEYLTNPYYVEHLQKARILATKVIGKVYQSAMAGDVGAAKLYFNVMGFLNNGGMQIQNQNNYIQINGMVIKQETVQRLNPEQLLTIEAILKTIIPQPEAMTVENKEISSNNINN